MDANRFDTLLRTLGQNPSRRDIARLLAASALGGLLTLGAFPADAKNKKKKRKKKATLCHDGQTIVASKKARKKHLRHGDAAGACPPSPPPPSPPTPPTPPSPPPPPPPPPCIPDGCSGACGVCSSSGGACAAGVCSCPNPQELCGDSCVGPCSAVTVRDPAACTCCKKSEGRCSAGSECCSGVCQVGSSGSRECRGRWPGEGCDFNAQCRHGQCSNGTCRCPLGAPLPCGAGFCRVSCPPGRIQEGGECDCCLPNASNCGLAPSDCCAGSGQCINDVCLGLPDEVDCRFDDQCLSGHCNRFGKCGEPVIDPGRG